MWDAGRRIIRRVSFNVFTLYGANCSAHRMIPSKVPWKSAEVSGIFGINSLMSRRIHVEHEGKLEQCSGGTASGRLHFGET